MRTIVKETTVYNFEELSKESQQKAIENLRDINVNYEDWDECVLDDQKEKLEDLGFTGELEICYSGFGSQGDGASFTCKDINFAKVIPAIGGYKFKHKALEKLFYQNCKGSVDRGNWRYVHEHSTNCNYAVDFYTFSGYQHPRIYATLEDIAARLEGQIKDYIVELNKAIYRAIKSEYEALQTDEAIRDTIEANGYEFTEDGTLY